MVKMKFFPLRPGKKTKIFAITTFLQDSIKFLARAIRERGVGRKEKMGLYISHPNAEE